MSGLEVDNADGSRLRLGGKRTNRERKGDCCYAGSNGKGRSKTSLGFLRSFTTDLEESRRLKTRKRTHGSSAAIEFCEFATTICASIQMGVQCRHLHRGQLSVEIGGQLFTEMLTRQKVEGNIEHGEDPHGSPHLLQTSELSDCTNVVLEGNDNLIEFHRRQSTIEVARQQHRKALTLGGHTGHVSSPLNMNRPLWILDRTVPTGTSAASAISS